MGLCGSKPSSSYDPFGPTAEHYRYWQQPSVPASPAPAPPPAFRPVLAQSRANARANVPKRPRSPEQTVKLLRNDSDGCLIETTIINPTDADRREARQQKADLLTRLGADGVARLRPDGYATESKEHFTLEFDMDELMAELYRDNANRARA